MTLQVRTLVLVANPVKPEAKKEVPRMSAWFRRRGIKILPMSMLAQSDAVVTLGGDGTILSVAPRAALAGVPVLGVNLGRLGFMTATGLTGVYKKFSAWLEGRWLISERMMIEVKVPRVKKPLLALNDAVLRLGASSRLTAIEVSIEKENLGLFTGDGVIVATSTGSTAYSMAAQGPVVHPDVEALILTPICAHSFTQRPVVFPATQTLELRLQDWRRPNEVQLSLDGQRVFDLRTGDRVQVCASPFKLKLLQDPKVPYFGVLREKLQWGGR